MTARTGTTREARTLSGCDVGREVLVYGDGWTRIDQIDHYHGGVDIYLASNEELHFAPTDTVTIRGRDE